VAAPRERRIDGIETRRWRGRRPDSTTWRGIPVTNVPETLVALAAESPSDELARAFHEAGIHHHTTPAQVEAVLARRPNVPGVKKLRAVIHGDTAVSLSRLESRFRERLLEASLPPPPWTNRLACSHRVDCRWPEQKLTVELDSYRYHRSRHSWEQDRRREREAYVRRDEFRRYTHHDVFDEPGLMLAELRRLLL
jgi:hypothetical protein